MQTGQSIGTRDRNSAALWGLALAAVASIVSAGCRDSGREARVPTNQAATKNTPDSPAPAPPEPRPESRPEPPTESRPEPPRNGAESGAHIAATFDSAAGAEDAGDFMNPPPPTGPHEDVWEASFIGAAKVGHTLTRIEPIDHGEIDLGELLRERAVCFTSARAVDRFADAAPDHAEGGETASCDRCGVPTTSGTCAFCRLVERAAGAQPVALTRKGRPIDA